MTVSAMRDLRIAQRSAYRIHRAPPAISTRLPSRSFCWPDNDNLLVAVQAGADFDFLSDRRPDFDRMRIYALAVRIVDKHIGRALRIVNNRLARKRQDVSFGRAENAGFRHHAGQQHRAGVGHDDLHRVGARRRFGRNSDDSDFSFEPASRERGRSDFALWRRTSLSRCQLPELPRGP